jgi:hypothetical protein
MKILFQLALVPALLSPASLGATQHDSRFRRGDLVVTGQVKTRDYEALDGEFNLSLVMIADLRISKVLRGRAPSRTVRVRYIGHMDLPEDGELRFHLRRASRDTWLVCKDGHGDGYICR